MGIVERKGVGWAVSYRDTGKASEGVAGDVVIAPDASGTICLLASEIEPFIKAVFEAALGRPFNPKLSHGKPREELET